MEENLVGAGFKVGFIGCGKVAHFHADVLNALGVEICAVCGSTPESSTAKAFAEKYHVSHVYPNAQALLAEDNADFLWVVTTWDVTQSLLVDLLKDGRPSLVEKPIATHAQHLQDVRNVAERLGVYNLYCGMNRRHYDFIPAFQNLLKDDGVRFAQVNIAEQSQVYDISDPNEANRVQNLWLNSSIHEVDLMVHLLGDLCVKDVYRKHDAQSGWLTSVNAVLETQTGCPVFLVANWNSSTGKSVLVETTTQTIHLVPIETMTVSSGLKRLEPTPETPIARYVPHVLQTHDTSRQFKPGFYNQAQDFIHQVKLGHFSECSKKSLEDAHRVLTLIEALLDH